ncbi:WW domain-binding protein 4 [Silurus meridionalis]|nr:WW domain-binding protein 4 [Silurus meridionalis]
MYALPTKAEDGRRGMSVEFHERGKNHKQNVTAKIEEIKKNSTDKAKKVKKMSKEFAVMEEAALKAYEEDMKRLQAEEETSVPARRNIKKCEAQDIAEPDKKSESDRWVLGTTDTGQIYYYNTRTGDQPENDEQETTVEVDLQKEEKDKVNIESSAPIEKEKTLVKKPRPTNPYGIWEQIQEDEDPYENVDLQLPQKESAGSTSTSSDVLPKPKTKFKERTITSLGDESCLGDTLSKIVKSYDTVSSNIKLKEQQIRCITNEIKQVQRQNERQQTEIQVIQMENMELKYRIEEQLERSHFYLTQYNTYHNKMESYKMSFSGMKSQAAIHKELKERREEVKRLKEHREELKVDLQNPEGNAMQRAQKQVDNFKAVIHNTKELVRRKGILLEKEKTNQSQLNKDIAIHNRRCEAIVKRLCCQLNKAHSSHGQLSSDIIHIEKEVEHLKTQLGSSYSVETDNV